MYEEIVRATEDLRNTKAGWVTRRDAAEHLGRAAAMALVVLHEHREEMDTDVHRSIEKALGQASAALRGIAPEVPEKSYSLEDLAKGCEKGEQRLVTPHGKGYMVKVQLHQGRHQDVSIDAFRRKDGIELIRVHTYCGACTEDRLAWALRANAKLIQGALALEGKEREEQFVLMNCFLAGEVSPREIKASVKEIAFYGDWIEQRLTGKDDF